MTYIRQSYKGLKQHASSDMHIHQATKTIGCRSIGKSVKKSKYGQGTSEVTYQLMVPIERDTVTLTTEDTHVKFPLFHAHFTYDSW